MSAGRSISNHLSLLRGGAQTSSEVARVLPLARADRFLVTYPIASRSGSARRHYDREMPPKKISSYIAAYELWRSLLRSLRQLNRLGKAKLSTQDPGKDQSASLRAQLMAHLLSRGEQNTAISTVLRLLKELPCAGTRYDGSCFHKSHNIFDLRHPLSIFPERQRY